MSVACEKGVSHALSGHLAAEEKSNVSGAHMRAHTNSKARPTLVCPELGCSYSGVFRRQYELQRHLATHDRRFWYECPAFGCTREGKETRFARVDKLTAHMRSLHHSGQFRCPHIGCLRSCLDRFDMFVHVQSHIDSPGKKADGQLRAIANGLSPIFRQCSITICGRTLSSENMIDHLLSHEMHEVKAPDELAAEGYLYGSSAGDEEPFLNLSWTSPFIRVFIVCPLCSSKCPDHKSFEAHLMEDHMHRDAQHFDIWLAHVKGRLLSHGYTMPDATAGKGTGQLACLWKAWRFVLMSSRTVAIEFCCPDCKTIEQSTDDLLVVHHLSMLDNPAKFYASRRRILSLCPSFASHPVFKDLQVADGIQEPHVVRLRVDTNSTKEKASSFTTYSSRRIVSESAYQSAEPTWRRELPFDLPLDTSVEYSLGALHGMGGQFAASPETVHAACKAYQCAHSNTTFATLPPLISPSPEVGNAILSTARGVADDRIEEREVDKIPTVAERSHGNGRKYACGHLGCGLRFERRSELNSHQRKHVMKHERPHKCDACDHTFMFAKDLARHQRTHEKSLCPVPECDHTSTRRAVRDRHMIDVHGRRKSISQDDTLQ